MTSANTRRVGDVPILEMEPDAPGAGGLVIWIPPLGGDKERYRGLLEGFARQGLLAVGIDPRRHGEPVDQGRAPAGAEWLHEQLDPVDHPGRYRRGQAIRFDVGTADSHVPAEAARRFASLVDGGAGVDVVDHPGLDHPDICRDVGILEAAASWLSAGAGAAAR